MFSAAVDPPFVSHALQIKLCYICREEERYDSTVQRRSYLSLPLKAFAGPQDPPTRWVHPCKCTLVAHESCLHHWIKTQQRDFGRSKALKCPQCGDRYETEGFNSLTLPLLDIANHILTHSGRIITICCAGTIVLSFGAGEHQSASLGHPPLIALTYHFPQASISPSRPTALSQCASSSAQSSSICYSPRTQHAGPGTPGSTSRSYRLRS